MHLSKPLSHHVAVEAGAGAAANVSLMMAANKPACNSTMEDFRNQNSQLLMVVSQDDLERVVQKAIGKLLDQRENKQEVYLTAEETSKRLKVDRSTLWRWNKEGYLVSAKVGSKVRYKLSDVERIQKGEVL